MIKLLQKLKDTPNELTKEELSYLISNISDEDLQTLITMADKVRRIHFKDSVYMRALIEFSSYCAQNCYYCGIRGANTKAERYRLSKEQILECCQVAYEMDYRTFVLQSGEDLSYSTDELCDIVHTIKTQFPNTAITMSIGEKSYEEYLAYYQAGADRYLLRHEAASRRLYEHIHPPTMSFDNRRECLANLKKIGFQTGAGFMVGLPTQTSDDLAEDILFIRELQPHMVGIGPYLNHHQTPFKDENKGTLRETIIMLALTRLTLPKVLLPATTSLGTLDPEGRGKGLFSGANVVMPNVSPKDVRKKYLLYDGKVSTGDEAIESHRKIAETVRSLGFSVDMQIGHHPSRSKINNK